MNTKAMHDKIDEVLAGMDAQALEDRIAPVKCEKNPEAPECQMVTFYGVTDYGIPEPDEP